MRCLRPTTDPQQPDADLVGCCSMTKINDNKQKTGKVRRRRGGLWEVSLASVLWTQSKWAKL